jgi:prepilin-type processing-associated H-X9-DG protein
MAMTFGLQAYSYVSSKGAGYCHAELHNRPAENLPCVDNGGAWNILAARSRHPGGVNAAMCDGTVRFIRQNIDISIWRALSTISGGEPLGDF